MKIRYTAVAAAAAAVLLGGTSAIARTAPLHHNPSVITASARPQVAGRVGWQGQSLYHVRTGLSGLFFHYPCPSGLVAENGGFSASDTAGTLRLIQSAPWWSLGDNLWMWSFRWPGGAAAGETISFDVYCTNVP
jgi:hypothetical protein